MAINTIEAAKIFQTALDLQMMQGATSGWMEDNAGQTKYSGGNEVKIPKMSLSGLGKYNRDSGYVQGAITYSYETRTLTRTEAESSCSTRWTLTRQTSLQALPL